MNLKGISVVIPNYNGRNLFPQTLPFVFKALENCGLPFEVIIVDDCSTDESVEFLRQNYPQIQVVVNEVNRGFAPTINRGAFLAKFDLLFLLNSDVKLEPDYFEYLIPYFDQPDTFGVMGRIENWDDDTIQDGAKFPAIHGVKIKTFVNYLPVQKPIEQKVWTMYLSGAEALVRTEKFVLLGGFDEIFAPYYIEDYELSLRAWRLGWVCYYEHKSVCRHKTSSSIKSKSRKRQIQTIYYRNKIFLHKIHLTPQQFFFYAVQLSLECLLRVITLKFYYINAIMLFLKARQECNISRKKFETLAKRAGVSLSVRQVRDKILQNLRGIPLSKF
ncbi:MAG: family 2 glycosyl transferase [Bacteroidetes bacterium OLB12]|nr:MAG: family 2 glycosyl transferase [Bacteroidetes bacterium OLB12]